MVRSRFAPSPTGPLHLGGARTALFAWLEAKARGGEFLLRLEDTDASRSKEEHADSIGQALLWLGMAPDGEVARQKDNAERHRQVAEQLLQAGRAYRCYCGPEELDKMRRQAEGEGRKPRYDGRCRSRKDAGDGPHVIRFRSPDGGSVTLRDRVQGEISFANDELDDLVIVRSDGSPTYHLAVVVDDSDMGVTEVIRGSDHLNNTPRQMHIVEAIGAEPPRYAHLPLLLAANGKPLSKRDKSADILEYREQGFLPQAMVNYLARLGWSHGDQEVFTPGQLQRLFSVDKVHAAPARCDPDKLHWINQQHITRLPPAEQGRHLAAHLASMGITAEGVDMELLLQQMVPRNDTFAKMARAAAVFYRDPEIDEAAASKHLTPDNKLLLQELLQELQGTDWQQDALHQALQQVVERHGIKFGKLAQAVRVAVCGGTASPPIDLTLLLVGKEGALRRLRQAVP